MNELARIDADIREADYSPESMADHERETFETHFPSLDFTE